MSLLLERGVDLLHLLVESIVDYAIFALDAEGAVVSWNLGAERMKGWTPEEIIGRHFSALYLPEDVEARKPWRELEAAQVQGRFEEVGWRMRKDGSRFLADVVITVLRDPRGNLVGFANVTRDLTESAIAEGIAKDLAVLEERERIGRDLTGSAIHSLFGIGLHLEGLTMIVSDQMVQDRLVAAVDDLDRIISELREYVHPAYRHPTVQPTPTAQP